MGWGGVGGVDGTVGCRGGGGRLLGAWRRAVAGMIRGRDGLLRLSGGGLLLRGRRPGGLAGLPHACLGR
ncbi:hypothetical protein DSECCO2_629410 [anaerobic digester metagenome]